MLSDDSSMLVMSQMLTSFSHEMSYVLSRRRRDAASDGLTDKLLVSVPDVADVCCHLLHSDAVSSLSSSELSAVSLDSDVTAMA